MLPVCELTNLHHLAIILGVAITEYWLGKTAKLKSGSIIELILNTFVSIMNRMIKKGEDNGNKNDNT